MYSVIEIESICYKAIEHFGRENQINKCIEEIEELKKELCDHYSIHPLDELKIFKVIDELADVFIMINQMKIIFGEQDFWNRVTFKLDRLQKMMEIKKNEENN